MPGIHKFDGKPSSEQAQSHHAIYKLPLALSTALDNLIKEHSTWGPNELRKFAIAAAHALTIYECIGTRWCYYQSPSGDFEFFHDVSKELVSEGGVKVLLANTPYENLSFNLFVTGAASWMNGSPYEELEKADEFLPQIFAWAQRSLSTPPIPAKPSPTPEQIQSIMSNLLHFQSSGNRKDFVELSTLPQRRSSASVSQIVPEIRQHSPGAFQSLVQPKLVEHVMGRDSPILPSPFMAKQKQERGPRYMLHEDGRMAALLGDKYNSRYQANLVIKRGKPEDEIGFKALMKNMTSNWVQAHYPESLGCFQGWIYEHDAGSFHEIDTALSHEICLEDFAVFEFWMEDLTGTTIDLCGENYRTFKTQQSEGVEATCSRNDGTSSADQGNSGLDMDTNDKKTIYPKARHIAGYKLLAAGSSLIRQQMPRHPNTFLRKNGITELNKRLKAARAAFRAQIAASRRSSSPPDPSLRKSTLASRSPLATVINTLKTNVLTLSAKKLFQQQAQN